MKLEDVVPWGRSLEEYRLMFALSEADLERKILGCGDGPASFNAELTLAGGNVVSIDPTYQYNSGELGQRIDEVRCDLLAQMNLNRENYVWDSISSVAELESIRMRAMRTFLADFEEGKSAKRYQCQALPELSFANQEFDLALCSHFLFLYSEQVVLQTHLASVLELSRVAKEVRIYPLLSLDGRESPHLTQVIATLCAHGNTVRLEHVDYEFQRGAREMMVVSSNQPQD
ncbi:MAG: SAM-dependent methyltransferase [Pseudohongiella sp.]|nr:MAG: SAM-dependent methyltransferase [Pseudohongiella sp.]